MTYAAYLRICEPVSAAHEPDHSRWAACAACLAYVAYVASATRPRRRDSLMVEHAEPLRRAVTVLPVLIGAAGGERGLAAAMCMRAHDRWRAFAEFELAN